MREDTPVIPAAITTAEVSAIASKSERGEKRYDDIVLAATNDRTGKKPFVSLDDETKSQLKADLDAEIKFYYDQAEANGGVYPLFPVDRIGLLWAAALTFYGENSTEFKRISEKLRKYLPSEQPKPEPKA